MTPHTDSGNRDPVQMKESKLSTEEEKTYRIELEKYIMESLGTNVEKMENFPKYVPRQALTKFISKYELFKQVLEVQGSIIECGVYLGVD